MAKSPFEGTIHVPRLGTERIFNEAAALKYIKERSNIPVPTFHACFEDDNSAYLITGYVDGVSMSSLTGEEKAVVAKELDDHMKTLHSLHACRLRGMSGLPILPFRLLQKTFKDDWDFEASSNAEYVFCHNDLSQQNVIVVPKTLKIAVMIDWEYAGFFPEEFDIPFYKRLGPSVAINGKGDDTDKLMKFIEDHQFTSCPSTSPRLSSKSHPLLA